MRIKSILLLCFLNTSLFAQSWEHIGSPNHRIGSFTSYANALYFYSNSGIYSSTNTGFDWEWHSETVFPLRNRHKKVITDGVFFYMIDNENQLYRFILDSRDYERIDAMSTTIDILFYKDKLYVLTPEGIFESSDRGMNWNAIYDQTSFHSISKIHVSNDFLFVTDRDRFVRYDLTNMVVDIPFEDLDEAPSFLSTTDYSLLIIRDTRDFYWSDDNFNSVEAQIFIPSFQKDVDFQIISNGTSRFLTGISNVGTIFYRMDEIDNGKKWVLNASNSHGLSGLNVNTMFQHEGILYFSTSDGIFTAQPKPSLNGTYLTSLGYGHSYPIHVLDDKIWSFGSSMTTDLGETWNCYSIDSISSNSIGQYCLYELHRYGDILFAAYYSDKLVYSTNEGATWDFIPMPPTNDPFSNLYFSKKGIYFKLLNNTMYYFNFKTMGWETVTKPSVIPTPSDDYFLTYTPASDLLLYINRTTFDLYVSADYYGNEWVYIPSDLCDSLSVTDYQLIDNQYLIRCGNLSNFILYNGRNTIPYEPVIEESGAPLTDFGDDLALFTMDSFVFAYVEGAGILVSDTSSGTFRDFAPNFPGVDVVQLIYKDSFLYAVTRYMGIYRYGPYPSREDIIEPTEFKIYPNPVRSILNFQLPSQTTSNSLEITIYDALGRLILREERNSESLGELDVLDFASGFYVIQLKIGSEQYQSKFIKQ